MKSVIVTGAAGFLGFHLCQKYLSDGYTVFGLDNFLTGSKVNFTDLKNRFAGHFFPVEFDVNDDWTQILELQKIKNLRYIFHFASVACPDLFERHALEILQANSTGLKNAVRFADSHQARVIFASTSEIYGSSKEVPFEEEHWGFVNSFGPRSCYDEAKRFGEAFLFNTNKKNSTHHGLVRIFNTYGPRMGFNDHRVIQYFIRRALQNESLQIHGDGQQTRCFCYVDDLIEGIAAYAQSFLTEPVNLGHDQEITIVELAKSVKNLLKSNSPIEFFPARSDDPTRRQPSLKKAFTLLSPWKPQVSLTEGILKTTEFLKGQSHDSTNE